MKTEQQKENMRKHIAFLRDEAPKIRDLFSMDDFMISDSSGYPECGTAACSLGYAPISTKVPCLVSMADYSCSVFGVKMFHGDSLTDEWDYLFNGLWVDVNNTPEAAAARMEAVLYDQVPEDWMFSPEFAHPVVDTLEPVFSHYQKAKVSNNP